MYIVDLDEEQPNIHATPMEEEQHTEKSNALHTPIAKEKGAKKGAPDSVSAMEMDHISKRSRKEVT